MLGQQAGNQQAQATKLLYSGEQFDSGLQQYNLRARHYDPSSGRFNRLDQFSGNHHDPQSLHKYAYCHSDPVNCVDPSGAFLIISLVMAMAIRSILHSKEAPKVALGAKIMKDVNVIGTILYGIAVGFLNMWQQSENLGVGPAFIAGFIAGALGYYIMTKVGPGRGAAAQSLMLRDLNRSFSGDFIPNMSNIKRDAAAAFTSLVIGSGAFFLGEGVPYAKSIWLGIAANLPGIFTDLTIGE